jgi:hypothetical protein
LFFVGFFFRFLGLVLWWFLARQNPLKNRQDGRTGKREKKGLKALRHKALRCKAANVDNFPENDLCKP